MTQQITTWCFMYAPDYNLDDYKYYCQQGNYDEAMRSVFLWPETAEGPDGWIFLGRAQITFDPVSPEDLVEQQIAVLRGQRSDVQAKAQSAINKIEEKIQNLLAIGHTPKQSEVDDDITF